MYRVLGEMSKDEHAWYLVQFLTDKSIYDGSFSEKLANQIGQQLYTFYLFNKKDCFTYRWNSNISKAGKNDEFNLTSDIDAELHLPGTTHQAG